LKLVGNDTAHHATLGMSFTTFHFVWFLLIVLAVYHAFGWLRFAGAWQWGWLALASLFFYGYEDPKLLYLLGFSIVFNCLVGWKIAQQVVQQRGVSRGLLGGALVVNLLLIVSFKYAGMLGAMIFGADDPRTLWLKEIPLPIGISFYTFHAISFLVDLSRAGSREPALQPFCQELAGTGKGRLSGLGKLTLYINFFPQLISGPIMKAREFLPQIRGKSWQDVPWRQAIRYLILGFFLKLVVADNLNEQTALITTPVVGQMLKLDLLALLYGYSLQIFADFAGYSLIALGLAALCGYRLPLNFNFPYLASSITEFWRRWHISLSNWLRDYLYFPLGGNRKGAGRTYLNLFLVMFLGGLWHGADFRYAWWGIGHGVLLMIERRLGVTAEETSVKNGSLLRFVRMMITFQLVTWLWLLFIMPNMDHVLQFCRALWGNPFGVNGRMAYAVAIYALPVILYHIWGYVSPAWRQRVETSPRGQILAALAYGFMLYFIITNPGASVNFIYFQF
jgi:alginate O-acetyltransferase complex protein AlgI